MGTFFFFFKDFNLFIKINQEQMVHFKYIIWILKNINFLPSSLLSGNRTAQFKFS